MIDMKIAMCSQNKRTITPHAGKCRNFMIFEIENGEVFESETLELTRDEILFNLDANGAKHPIDHFSVLFAYSIGKALHQKLEKRNIKVYLTQQTEPLEALAEYLKQA